MTLRPRTLAVLLAAAVLVGCAGTARQHSGATSAPPVSVQVHDALANALHRMRHEAPLPFVAVGRCTGPAAGGAGRYRCETTPSALHGLREVIVDVRSDGTWSTSPVPVHRTFHGHRRVASSGMWGTGLHLPG